MLYVMVFVLGSPADVILSISFLDAVAIWLIRAGLSYRIETHLISRGTGWHRLLCRLSAQGFSWLTLLGRAVAEARVSGSKLGVPNPLLNPS